MSQQKGSVAMRKIQEIFLSHIRTHGRAAVASSKLCVSFRLFSRLLMPFMFTGAISACSNPVQPEKAAPIPAQNVQEAAVPDSAQEEAAPVDDHLRVTVDFDKKTMVADRGGKSTVVDTCNGKRGVLQTLGPPMITLGPKDNPMFEAMNMEFWIYESRDPETEEGMVVGMYASSGKIYEIALGSIVYAGIPKTREELEKTYGPCSSERAMYISLPAGWIACKGLPRVGFSMSDQRIEFKDADGVPRNDYPISMVTLKSPKAFCPSPVAGKDTSPE